MNEQQKEEYKIMVQDCINIDNICFEKVFKDNEFINSGGIILYNLCMIINVNIGKMPL